MSSSPFAPLAEEAPRCRVVAIESEHRFRTKLAIEFGSIGAQIFESPDDFEPQLSTSVPTVAIFGPSFACDMGLSYLAALTPDHPELAVILLADEMSVSLLQRALRSGVRDVLSAETTVEQLEETIGRLAETLTTVVTRVGVGRGEGVNGRVITTFSTKGGVGKSVTATNLACALAMKSKGNVVLVDADLQFGDVAVLLGVPPQHTTVDAAMAVLDGDEHMLTGYLGHHAATGLRVLPAPIEPSAADSITADQMLGIVRLLRRSFEYVVIDMPPHFDDMVLALLDEADDVVLVASMDIPSIKNLKVGLQTLNLLAIAGGKLRLLLNRANAKVNLDIADVERAIGVAAEFRIPSDISVPQAVNRGVPVVLDKPKSAAGMAYLGVADSFLAREDDGAGQQRRWSWRRDRDAAKGEPGQFESDKGGDQ